MTLSYALKAASILALLFFSLHMAHRNQDTRTRRRWKNIIAVLMLVYFAGEFIEEFVLPMP